MYCPKCGTQNDENAFKCTKCSTILQQVPAKTLPVAKSNTAVIVLAVIGGAIAIFMVIGILAAIAIPNFIAYRNKSFCSQAESDANNIAAAVADYYADPYHTSLPNLTDLGITLTGNPPNSAEITGDATDKIIITVKDVSCRCPDDYQNAVDGWDADTDSYTKILE